MPIDRIALRRGLAGEGAEVGHDEIRRAKINLVVFDVANGKNPQAEIGQLDIDARRDIGAEQRIGRALAAGHAPLLVGLAEFEIAMQERQMHRIDIAFVRLQVIARMMNLRDEALSPSGT